MEFEFCDARYMRDLLKALNVTGEEIKFKADFDGLSVMNVDSSHVVFLVLNMGCEVFDEYFCVEEEEFCVNVENLVRKVFRNIEKGERVAWKTDKEEQRLEIRFFGDIIRDFSVPLLKCDFEDLPEPQIDVKARFSVHTKVLKRILADAQSDGIVISVNDEGVTFSTGDEDVKHSVHLDRYSPSIVDLRCEKDSKACYSVAWLNSFVKALSPIAEVVTIEFSTDMPMRFTGQLKYGVKLLYYLAPRFEDW